MGLTRLSVVNRLLGGNTTYDCKGQKKQRTCLGRSTTSYIAQVCRFYGVESPFFRFIFEKESTNERSKHKAKMCS